MAVCRQQSAETGIIQDVHVQPAGCIEQAVGLEIGSRKMYGAHGVVEGPGRQAQQMQYARVDKKQGVRASGLGQAVCQRFRTGTGDQVQTTRGFVRRGCWLI